MHLALQSRACVIALVILMDGMAPAHGQVSLVLGGALMTGKLQTPYVRPCSGEDASAFGPIAYAGFGLSAFSVITENALKPKPAYAIGPNALASSPEQGRTYGVCSFPVIRAPPRTSET